MSKEIGGCIEMPDEITCWNYIGTVQDVDGYVWHYYYYAKL